MLPRLFGKAPLSSSYQRFLDALLKNNYTGDIEPTLPDRIVMSTDNSIYQLIPELVLYPRTQQDIMAILSLAPLHPQVHFAPRGGGTGTNGQSLTDGIIIDCSKYMKNILDINLENKTVRVEPGVILDQLQAALKPHGYYFPVNISTGNRATLGGMVSTDACGQGSLQHGRTSRHLVACHMILSDGSFFNSTADARLSRIEALCQPHSALIKKIYPLLPRHATGYNLTDTITSLIAGSEGTLGVLTEITLRIAPIVAHKQLILIRHTCFDEALQEAARFTDLKPMAIEVMDERVTQLIRADSLYPIIQHLMDDTTRTITLMEFEHAHAQTLQDIVANAQKRFTTPYTLITDSDVAHTLWQCRKNSVGLLGKSDTYKRAIPFVEDAAVHPKDLAPFIKEFRAILDNHQLQYAMFGHADAGCIHVRPVLDLLLDEDKTLMVKISQDIFALTKKYNGILWGEHGLGFRSAYNPQFFGETLYQVFRQIKTLFDPMNQLNPGKLATPLGFKDTLYAPNGPLRAEHDSHISLKNTQDFSKSLHCNGNGLCFNENTSSVMCPSYKATRDRKHSPKGRAALLREWLAQLGDYNFKEKYKNNFIKRLCNTLKNEPDFSRDVFSALDGCVGCKGCKTECPVQVSIPEMKSTFLFHYYQRYLRPLSDFFIAHMETLSAYASRYPKCANSLMALCASWIGICNAPRLSRTPLIKQLPEAHITYEQAFNLPREKTVFLVQDALCSFYDADLIKKLHAFIKTLGFTLYILPFQANGKAQQVLGYCHQFEKTARKNISLLKEIEKTNIPMISFEPSIALTYRDEYTSLGTTPRVFLLQEWLATFTQPKRLEHKTYYLLSHCTEKTAALDNTKLWQEIFARCNLTLNILSTGCCGMAGAYGLTRHHLKTSEKIYALNWETLINTFPPDTLLATGFSCRRQVERFSRLTLKHPVEVLG